MRKTIKKKGTDQESISYGGAFALMFAYFTLNIQDLPVNFISFEGIFLNFTCWIIGIGTYIFIYKLEGVING